MAVQWHRRGLFRHWLRTTTALGGALTLVLTAPSAHANPEGGTVVAGDARIQQTGPKTLTVTQGSDKAVINWRTFDVGVDETTRFVQPSASSIALNRVTGDQVSRILGHLEANGRVVLVNPNGIVFGADARVDTAALVASTQDIDTRDFMAGHLRFDQPGAAGAMIVNRGTVTAAEGGLVALVAPAVRNSGILQARLGTVALAGGDAFTVDLYGDDLILFSATEAATRGMLTPDGTPVEPMIEHSGTILADGGRVLMTADTARAVVDAAINMDGLVSARRVAQSGGEIILDAGSGGTVLVSGTLDASGRETGQTGGSVHVLGDHVGLIGQAAIDVSGRSGGGEALIGGDYLGGGSVRTAAMTYMGSGTRVTADATDRGDGGKVILWSDDTTRAYGQITARGGDKGGDGGFVETSGRLHLEHQGAVDASATAGVAGTWLMDPQTIYVRDSVTNTNLENNPVACFGYCNHLTQGYAYFQRVTPTQPTYIGTASINNALRLGNHVVLSNERHAGADIFVEGDIAFSPTTVTGSRDVSLVLLAGRNIDVSTGSIRQTGTNGANVHLNVLLNAGLVASGDSGTVTVGQEGRTEATIDVGGWVDLLGDEIAVKGTSRSGIYTVTSGSGVFIGRRELDWPYPQSIFRTSSTPPGAGRVPLIRLSNRAIRAVDGNGLGKTVALRGDGLWLRNSGDGIPEIAAASITDMNNVGTLQLETIPATGGGGGTSGGTGGGTGGGSGGISQLFIGKTADQIYASVLENGWLGSYRSQSAWTTLLTQNGGARTADQITADVMLQAYRRFQDGTSLSTAYALYAALLDGAVRLDGIAGQQPITNDPANTVWRGIYGPSGRASPAQALANTMKRVRDRYYGDARALYAAVGRGEISTDPDSSEWEALKDGWDGGRRSLSTVQAKVLGWLDASSGEASRSPDKATDDQTASRDMPRPPGADDQARPVRMDEATRAMIGQTTSSLGFMGTVLDIQAGGIASVQNNLAIVSTKLGNTKYISDRFAKAKNMTQKIERQLATWRTKMDGYSKTISKQKAKVSQLKALKTIGTVGTALSVADSLASVNENVENGSTEVLEYAYTATVLLESFIPTAPLPFLKTPSDVARAFIDLGIAAKNRNESTLRLANQASDLMREYIIGRLSIENALANAYAERGDVKVSDVVPIYDEVKAKQVERLNVTLNGVADQIALLDQELATFTVTPGAPRAPTDPLSGPGSIASAAPSLSGPKIKQNTYTDILLSAKRSLSMSQSLLKQELADVQEGKGADVAQEYAAWAASQEMMSSLREVSAAVEDRPAPVAVPAL